MRKKRNLRTIMTALCIAILVLAGCRSSEKAAKTDLIDFLESLYTIQSHEEFEQIMDAGPEEYHDAAEAYYEQYQ